MKNFNDTLKKAAKKHAASTWKNPDLDEWVSAEGLFINGALWLKENLNLLDAKDFLKHKDVKKIIKYLKNNIKNSHDCKWLITESRKCNCDYFKAKEIFNLFEKK